MGIQLLPLLSDIQTPPHAVPAKRFVPSDAARANALAAQAASWEGMIVAKMGPDDLESARALSRLRIVN